MNTIVDLDSARRTVREFCQVDTSDLAPAQLLAILDGNIGHAQRGGDLLVANVLTAVRQALRAKADSLH